jgi:serine/threonine protein kinase
LHQVDVYSFGNVLYTLLMLKWPFYEVDDYDVAENDDNDDDYSAFIGEQVIQGRRPFIPEEIRKSSNAIERAMHMAIRMCFEADPAKRVSARQVETFLISQRKAIDPDRGRLETWRGDH